MKPFTNSTMRLTLMMGMITIAGIFSSAGVVSGQQTLDLKTPGGNEAFGGDSKGSVSIVPKEHTVNIVANMSTPPKEGNVFEGWLVVTGGSDYKLSVGEFSKNGALDFTSTMVNPYTYKQFLVTEEPFEDPDPNAASVIAGAELVSPFGQ
ncbi:MAG: hypothetical protein WAM19_10190 [Nitrososphaeraceae archaeon]